MTLTIRPLPSSGKAPRLGSTPHRFGAGRRCETCRHPNRHAIDLSILAGQSKRELAMRYGLSPSSIQRHREHCLPADLAQAQITNQIDRAEFLLAQSCALDREAAEIGALARQSGNPAVALSAISERRRILTLQSGLYPSQVPDQRKTADEAALQRLQEVILNALAEHPEARVAVAEALAPRQRRA